MKYDLFDDFENKIITETVKESTHCPPSISLVIVVPWIEKISKSNLKWQISGEHLLIVYETPEVDP